MDIFLNVLWRKMEYDIHFVFCQVVDKLAPARMSSSLVTSRHLTQRRVRLPVRKYYPKNDDQRVRICFMWTVKLISIRFPIQATYEYCAYTFFLFCFAVPFLYWWWRNSQYPQGGCSFPSQGKPKSTRHSSQRTVASKGQCWESIPIKGYFYSSAWEW